MTRSAILFTGFHHRVRSIAAYLIHIIRLIDLTSLRIVELEEIKKAGECWATSRAAFVDGAGRGNRQRRFRQVPSNQSDTSIY